MFGSICGNKADNTWWVIVSLKYYSDGTFAISESPSQSTLCEYQCSYKYAESWRGVCELPRLTGTSERLAATEKAPCVYVASLSWRCGR